MRVNKSSHYRQCKLRQGTKRQVAWIPAEIAKEGYLVSVGNSAVELNNQDKWIVDFAGIKVPASYVLTSREAISVKYVRQQNGWENQPL